MDLGDKLIQDFLDENPEQLLRDMVSRNPMELYHAFEKVAAKTWEFGRDFTIPIFSKMTEAQKNKYDMLRSPIRLERYICDKARKYGEDSLTEEEQRLTRFM